MKRVLLFLTGAFFLLCGLGSAETLLRHFADYGIDPPEPWVHRFGDQPWVWSIALFVFLAATPAGAILVTRAFRRMDSQVEA